MRVGSLVELVYDDWSKVHPANLKLTPVLPVRKKIYTVRKVYSEFGCIGIYLEEILSLINPISNLEQGFKISRFRELMPPTSISLESVLENELQES